MRMVDDQSFCSSDAASADELRDTDGMYRLLVECAADHGIFMLGPDGQVMSWNSGAERLQGYTAAEILGTHFSVFYIAEDQADDYPGYELSTAAEEGRFEDEGWRVRKDGFRFWANVVITAIRNQDGVLLGFGKVTRDLTLRRTIERQLEASEQRYRSLFENNPDAVYALDLNGCFTHVNRPALQLTGYGLDELIGSPFAPLITPDYLERTMEAFRAVIRGSPQQLETALLNNKGERRLLSVTVVPTFVDGQVDGAFGIAEDITDERSAEQERAVLLVREKLARSASEAAEERAHFLAEVSRILAESLDYSDTLRRVARLAVPRLADYCLVDVLEENGTVNRIEVCHAAAEGDEAVRETEHTYPVDTPRPNAVLKVLQTGNPVLVPEVTDAALDEIAHDMQRLCELREVTMYSYMCVPLRARGRMLGAISLACTQPDRHYSPAELEIAEDLARRAALAVDNARLYQAALSASQAKTDFLATMSHELRTPLNAIIGYTDLLAQRVSGPLTDTQAAQLDRIERSSRHLLQLIEEVLSFARMEAGREEVIVEPVSLSELVRDTAALTEPLASQKELAFEVRVPERDYVMETDAQKLRQILLNLLSNAIKFTDVGQVVLDAEVDGHAAILRVSDTGIGIPSEHLDSIFHPFHQVEREASRRVGGTGLGLSVTRHLARLLGGEITVSSTRGQGTTFTVALPMRVKGRETDT